MEEKIYKIIKQQQQNLAQHEILFVTAVYFFSKMKSEDKSYYDNFIEVHVKDTELTNLKSLLFDIDHGEGGKLIENLFSKEQYIKKFLLENMEIILAGWDKNRFTKTTFSSLEQVELLESIKLLSKLSYKEANNKFISFMNLLIAGSMIGGIISFFFMDHFRNSSTQDINPDKSKLDSSAISFSAFLATVSIAGFLKMKTVLRLLNIPYRFKDAYDDASSYLRLNTRITIFEKIFDVHLPEIKGDEEENLINVTAAK